MFNDGACFQHKPIGVLCQMHSLFGGRMLRLWCPMPWPPVPVLLRCCSITASQLPGMLLRMRLAQLREADTR